MESLHRQPVQMNKSQSQIKTLGMRHLGEKKMTGTFCKERYHLQ